MNLTKQTNCFFLLFFVWAYLYLYIPSVWTILSSMPIVPQQTATALIGFALPIAVYFLVTKNNIRETLRLKALSWKNVALAILFGFAMQPIMQFVSFWTSLFFPNAARQMLDAFSGLTLIEMLFIMVVLPAVLEELALRGVILSGYRRLGARKAVICSALLFAIMHGNLQQASYAFLAGLFFGFLVQRTGSIWASVIAHFTINATSVIAAFAPVADSTLPVETIPNTTVFLYAAFSAFLSLPFLGLLFYLLIKINPVPALAIEADTTAAPERFLTPSMLLVFVLFIIIGVLPYMGIF